MMNVTGNITKNFGLDEMACRDKDRTLYISPELVRHAQRLQEFRNWYNRPMKVNSWFRTKEHNASPSVKGKPDSRHLYGDATDIDLPDEYLNWDKDRKNEFLNNIKAKWQILCQRDGVRGGMGWYNGFIHFDSRPGEGPMAFWDER